MTPKDKAHELIYKFKDINDAIICVEEIIKSIRKDLPIFERGKGFWQEVLTHLKEML